MLFGVPFTTPLALFCRSVEDVKAIWLQKSKLMSYFLLSDFIIEKIRVVHIELQNLNAKFNFFVENFHR